MPMASSRRSSARAGARWRHDWGPGSDQKRPCTSGCSAGRPRLHQGDGHPRGVRPGAPTQGQESQGERQGAPQG
eukprot:9004722-Pyramimonas_sp.AAC.1